MYTMYNGDHSITFTTLDGTDEKNTWEDWFLIPSSRPTIGASPSQTKFIDIPGMNGSYDASEYLGTPLPYPDRSGSFEFIIDNGHADWITIYQDIVMWLHGQRLRMILSDDPDHYYEGRFSVSGFTSEKDNSKVTISYRVSPNKQSV